MRTYQIEWKMELEEYLLLRVKTDRNLHILSTVASILLAVATVWNFGEQRSFWFQVLLFFFTGFIIFFAMHLIALGSGKWKNRKQSGPLEMILLTIDQNGIKGESQEGFFQLQWKQIQEVKEVKNYLKIQAKRKETLFIPERCFKGLKQKKEILFFIHSCIQQSQE